MYAIVDMIVSCAYCIKVLTISDPAMSRRDELHKYLLEVYLRDYVSIYYNSTQDKAGSNRFRRNQENDDDLNQSIRYWTHVQTGNSDEKGESVATKLKWPRATLVIHPSNISQDGRLITGLPRLLSNFKGGVRLTSKRN